VAEYKRRSRAKINVKKRDALDILEEEAKRARLEPVDNNWVTKVQRLSSMCVDKGSRTHIAMLGTAMLAKATNPKVDVFAIKARADSDGAYSARGIGNEVLAAHAPRLGIDLGVTGREPLNNQPYFHEDSVRELEPFFHAHARPAYHLLLEILTELDTTTPAETRHALRAFLHARAKKPRTRDLDESPVAVLERSFAASLAAFTDERSDGGKRAQAVAAGILDAMYSDDRVLVARVNDPDRHFPGDVAIAHPPSKQPEYVPSWEHEGKIDTVYEVRDKLVADSDLFHFVEKAARQRIRRAAVIGAHRDQRPLLLSEVEAHAQSQRVKLTMFVHWRDFVSDALFYSTNDPASVLDLACKRILTRLQELDAPDDTLDRWIELVSAMEQIPPPGE
jgi:hypothetical protein